MSHQANLANLKTVFNALGDLHNSVVFVGGATVSLYDQTEAFEVRETKDVDVIVKMASYSQHANFEEQLRRRGFVDVVYSKIRGRFKIEGVTVDVIPTTDLHMGFENIWYPEGYQEAVEYRIDGETVIRILTAPYFIATKLEAFKGRGGRDPRTSHDFEDIVHVMEYRGDIWAELRQTDKKLNAYLKGSFETLINNPNVYEWIDCHVDFRSPPPTDYILEGLRNFVGG